MELRTRAAARATSASPVLIPLSARRSLLALGSRAGTPSTKSISDESLDEKEICEAVAKANQWC